ncbi:hypothetical protein TNCV_1441061 [Trichonephila clavipes]|nr:hypothetical protein TNCV_1441061 [Trichonephila clavipes]
MRVARQGYYRSRVCRESPEAYRPLATYHGGAKIKSPNPVANPGVQRRNIWRDYRFKPNVKAWGPLQCSGNDITGLIRSRRPSCGRILQGVPAGSARTPQGDEGVRAHRRATRQQSGETRDLGQKASGMVNIR